MQMLNVFDVVIFAVFVVIVPVYIYDRRFSRLLQATALVSLGLLLLFIELNYPLEEIFHAFPGILFKAALSYLIIFVISGIIVGALWRRCKACSTGRLHDAEHTLESYKWGCGDLSKTILIKTYCNRCDFLKEEIDYRIVSKDDYGG